MLSYLKKKLGQRKYIILFFISTIVIETIIAIILKDVNMKEFLEMQVTTDKSKFISIIHSWNNLQIKEYHQHFYFDFLYLISYSLLMFSIVSRFYIHAKVTNRGIIFLILPFIIAFFDSIENLFHIYFFTVDYKAKSILFVLSGVFSIQKWVFFLIEIYVIIILFFKLVILHKKL